ncbi:MAG: PqqD family protein [Clostridia bacterium]|nr:PqqD family protein [Clostridia bacterium]
MRIKKGFVLEKVGESYLCCATGKLAREFSGFVRLNETGAFLWKMLESGNPDVDEMVKNMTDEYDISEEIARGDINAFLKKLEENRILEEK